MTSKDKVLMLAERESDLTNSKTFVLKNDPLNKTQPRSYCNA